MKFYTIGVYNSTAEEFFKKLTQNRIDTFYDIRQLRGVRGAQYSFVNSNKLQSKLNDLGIRYVYEKDLAPTNEVRAIQKKADEKYGIQQRKRQELSSAFVMEYNKSILSRFDFEHFIENLKKEKCKRIVLFCVEENHEACHRSIVSTKLTRDYKFEVTHL